MLCFPSRRPLHSPGQQHRHNHPALPLSSSEPQWKGEDTATQPRHTHRLPGPHHAAQQCPSARTSSLRRRSVSLPFCLVHPSTHPSIPPPVCSGDQCTPPLQLLTSVFGPVLQDPSVAASPIEKRIAFLQAKNLTPEEVSAALSRVAPAEAGAVQVYSPPQASSPAQSPPQYYGQYPPPQYSPYAWPQPPPDVPRRDWRDWFIMATVVGGVGYGLFSLGKASNAPPLRVHQHTARQRPCSNLTRSATCIPSSHRPRPTG